MKSIIQEGSSIEKAVRQSWEKAGKPEEFSIKVLEVEEKNFLGFTRKPAKIAIFFEERSVQAADKKKRITRKPTEKRQPMTRVTTRRTTTPRATTPRTTRATTKVTTPKTRKPTEKREPKTENIIAKERELWSKELVETATNWTKNVLIQFNLPNVKFATIAKQKNLSFNFYAPLIKDKKQQTMLFKNLAFLLMQTLRYRFKKSLRNLNVIFSSKQET